jgi:hypothetical protein
METLTQILASFDIFQVIISAFPQIFLPVAHAFQSMYVMLSEMAGKMFTAHPGLISGAIVFIFIYATWSALLKLKRAIVSARTTPSR